MTDICLKTSQVEFQYKNGQLLRFPDFEMPLHEQLLLLGASGSGKTTLLKLLSGLLSPQKGEVSCFGKDLRHLNQSQLDVFRAGHIGMALGESRLLPALSLSDNLALSQRIARGQTDKAHSISLLNALAISHLGKKKAQAMSTGELQRAILALALAKKPLLLLADEPTSHLDDANCEAVMALLMQITQQHKTAMLIVTHDSRVKKYFSKTIQL